MEMKATKEQARVALIEILEKEKSVLGDFLFGEMSERIYDDLGIATGQLDDLFHGHDRQLAGTIHLDYYPATYWEPSEYVDLPINKDGGTIDDEIKVLIDAVLAREVNDGE